MRTAAMLLVVAGCTSGTEQPREPAKPSAVKPPAATRPAATPWPYDRLPARPLGEAAAAGRDSVFLRKAFASSVPAGYQVPPVDEVAVIHRLSAETGELAWMPDGRTFCYGMVRGGYSSFRCGRLPEEAPAPGLLLTHRGDSYRVTSEDNLDEVRNVSFVIAEGGPKRFDHVKRSKGMGVVHQAVARFPSGLMVTFLTFDYPEHGWELDPEAEICRSDRAICFPSEPVPY
ncbi:hypothetical protein [Streptomyces sp. SS]|uniref:hypothetical protein n=1 Tax=Streptomyces sp. SS TaxID=260742 RepID=UPI001ED9A065|nr:hypothetical protein [Streptomyces sp. SS]